MTSRSSCRRWSAASATVSGQQPAERWWSHVDVPRQRPMKGRDTGSPEHRKAAEYIADHFKRAGLEPGGTKGYFQPVPFRSRRIVEAQSSLALVRDRQGRCRSCSATKRRSRCASSRRRASRRRWCSPATGCRCPESKHDDLAGLDLKGKIVRAADRRPVEHSRAAARALPEHALGVPEEGRRPRHHLDPEPERAGHPVGSIEAVALHALGGDRRSGARRNARPAGGGDVQPGARRRSSSTAPGTRSRSCSRCRTTARCCRGFALPASARVKVAIDADDARVRQRHRHPAAAPIRC